ncbi:hypothetical protein [Streptacidiphilus sp. P02-A3a]|uniref:hypothetical protein n=1 Tax=Streptacidiphilus sp. P02-A3a TaxID=2704468 RepID=UPI0015FE17CB|nr:hypothetical protein [Streptacidiphilus sp. P02-A3a]QMU68289.1 hypothetical protein GXP74_08665 [Streptacidiphilus sp. P02-A3a]
MIIEKAAVRIAVELGRGAAGSSGSRLQMEEYSASFHLLTRPEVCVSIEVLRRLGGMRSRALVGGCFEARQAGPSSMEVFYEDAHLGTGREAGVPSELGPPLVTGLPSDFLGAVLGGLRAGVDRVSLPSGRLTVDRAAYSEADSSSRAFSGASTLLVVAIDSMLSGKDVEAAIGGAIRDL